MVVVQNKCALDKQGPLQRATDSLWFPIVQELVNEGKLTGAGSAFHSWGRRVEHGPLVLGGQPHRVSFGVLRDGEPAQPATPDVHRADIVVVFGAQGKHVRHGEDNDARADHAHPSTVVIEETRTIDIAAMHRLSAKHQSSAHARKRRVLLARESRRSILGRLQHGRDAHRSIP